MRNTPFLCLLALSGVLAFCPAQASAPIPSPLHLFPYPTYKDPRLTRLEGFFSQYGCPARRIAQVFLDAADMHRIDWRLLPSIAFIESGGGKAYRRNNILGWGNGSIAFRSVEQGIHRVAERLANSHYYRGKPVDKILFTYNPRPGYSGKVKGIMSELSSYR